jgi:hypothetical protein
MDSRVIAVFQDSPPWLIRPPGASRVANEAKTGYAEGPVCRKDNWPGCGVEPPHGREPFQDAGIGEDGDGSHIVKQAGQPGTP